MTLEEIDKFRNKFRAIVYQNSQIAKYNKTIIKLTRFDKDGSHFEAIKRIQLLKKRELERFNLMLEGKTYKDWIEFSKKLSKLSSQYKSAILQATRKDLIIKELKF